MDCHVDGHRKRIGRNRGLTEAVLRKRKVQIAEGEVLIQAWVKCQGSRVCYLLERKAEWEPGDAFFMVVKSAS